MELLGAVTPPLLKCLWRRKGEEDFYSPFHQLQTPSSQSKKRANKQTKGLFSVRQKWTFASVSLTHARSLLKVTSCLHWVNLLCRNNGRYLSVRSIMFSPLRLRSAINIMPPFISVHQATVRCRKLHGGRMSCWFNVWVPVSKVDHSCWAHSHLLSVSRRLPCIFKKPLQWERHTYSF